MLSRVILCCCLALASCSGHNRNVKIKGSDTEVNLAVLLAEDFHKVNDTLTLSVSGGGSGLGIASLLNGTADIANSSRAINKEELKLFEKKSIILRSFIFAQDAIAFVVSETLPLDSISTDQLAALFSGQYTNWKALTQEHMPVNIYGRQSNSGTHDFVQKVLHIKFTPFAKQMNGNAQIIEAIREDRSGIGYVGAGYVQGPLGGIKILKVYTRKGKPAISPLDAKQIARGSYFFQRPLFQYYRARDEQKVRPFLRFERSPAGIRIIQSTGYYPTGNETNETAYNR